MLTEQMFFEKRIKYLLLDRKTTDFFDEKPPHNPSVMRGFVFPIIPYQVITGNYSSCASFHMM